MNLSTCHWSTKILDLQKLELAILQKNYDASVVGNRLDDNNNQIANNYIANLFFGGIVKVSTVSKL